jgi:hypothetical protein
MDGRTWTQGGGAPASEGEGVSQVVSRTVKVRWFTFSDTAHKLSLHRWHVGMTLVGEGYFNTKKKTDWHKHLYRKLACEMSRLYFPTDILPCENVMSCFGFMTKYCGWSRMRAQGEIALTKFEIGRKKI